MEIVCAKVEGIEIRNIQAGTVVEFTDEPGDYRIVCLRVAGLTAREASYRTVRLTDGQLFRHDSTSTVRVVKATLHVEAAAC